jgi:undecaprenyl-diphosphatase
MPSGHTALSFAGLVMLGMLMPRFKWLTWTLAILIAVSRVAIGAHWPTDVLLGAFVGMVAADFVLAIVQKINN